MGENSVGVEQEVQVRTQEEKGIYNKVGILHYIAMVLLGICLIVKVVEFVRGFQERIWNDIGVAGFMWQSITMVIIAILFITLLDIAIKRNPFAISVIWYIRSLGVLLLVASVLVPRLQGYQAPNFQLLAIGNSVWIEGGTFVFGILMFILVKVFQAGSQNTTEESARFPDL